jgi:hypothetical protein
MHIFLKQGSVTNPIAKEQLEENFQKIITLVSGAIDNDEQFEALKKEQYKAGISITCCGAQGKKCLIHSDKTTIFSSIQEKLTKTLPKSSWNFAPNNAIEVNITNEVVSALSNVGTQTPPSSFDRGSRPIPIPQSHRRFRANNSAVKKQLSFKDEDMLATGASTSITMIHQQAKSPQLDNMSINDGELSYAPTPSSSEKQFLLPTLHNKKHAPEKRLSPPEDGTPPQSPARHKHGSSLPTESFLKKSISSSNSSVTGQVTSSNDATSSTASTANLVTSIEQKSRQPQQQQKKKHKKRHQKRMKDKSVISDQDKTVVSSTSLTVGVQKHTASTNTVRIDVNVSSSSSSFAPGYQISTSRSTLMPAPQNSRGVNYGLRSELKSE